MTSTFPFCFVLGFRLYRHPEVIVAVVVGVSMTDDGHDVITGRASFWIRFRRASQLHAALYSPFAGAPQRPLQSLPVMRRSSSSRRLAYNLYLLRGPILQVVMCVWGGGRDYGVELVMCGFVLVGLSDGPFRGCMHDLSTRPALQEGRSRGVMCSYNAVTVDGQFDNVPSCANDWLLKTTLRDSWRFDGYQ